MWILADWLAEFNPEVQIAEGKRTLLNVRLRLDGSRPEWSTVYVGTEGDKIACVNGHDTLLLHRGALHDILNRILDAFDFYQDWSDRLNDKAKTDCALADLLLDSAPVLGRMAAVADTSYNIIAQIGIEAGAGEKSGLRAVPGGRIISLDSILAIHQDQRLRVNNPQTYFLDVPRTGIRCAVRNIFFLGQHCGWLITDKQSDRITQGEADIQAELGDNLERWMEYHRDQRELIEKSGVFLQILEGNVRKVEDVYRRIESLNWQRGDELQVYVVRPDAERLPPAYIFDRDLEQYFEGYAVHFKGQFLYVVNNTRTDLWKFDAAFKSMLENAGCICGRSPKFCDILDLSTHYELAGIAAGFASDNTSRIRDLESAALSYYISLILKYDKAGVVHPAPQILRDYDHRHKTALYETLETFLRHERNYIHTAQELHLHRNTLIYRIERIVTLTGVDLDVHENRLHILISYEIDKLRHDRLST
jgi:hypothetical protein